MAAHDAVAHVSIVHQPVGQIVVPLWVVIWARAVRAIPSAQAVKGTEV